MAINEILPFATVDTGTNLLTQAEYAVDAERDIGNTGGTYARSKLVNKSLKQTSTISSGLAQFISEHQLDDIVDTMTPQEIADRIVLAFYNIAASTARNFIRNNQFTLWNNLDYNLIAPDMGDFEDSYAWFSVATGDENPQKNLIASDWVYLADNVSAEINIRRGSFAAGQAVGFGIPNNPLSFLEYRTITPGTGEGYIAIAQIFQGAQTFAGETMTFSFWAASENSTKLEVRIRQMAGTGGSPTFSDTITVIIPETDLSSSIVWNNYTATFQMPPIPSGSTMGTDGNDRVQLEFYFTEFDVDRSLLMTEVQLCYGGKLPAYSYKPLQEQVATSEWGSTFQMIPTGAVLAGTFPAGSVYPGWIICDDGTIGAPGSNASREGSDCINLYLLIWNSVDNSYAEVRDSTGAPVPRSTTAIEDWNLQRQIQITQLQGRAICGAGSGAGLTTRSNGENFGSERVSLTSNQNGPHSHSVSPTSPLVLGSGLNNYLTPTPGGFQINSSVAFVGTSGSGAPHENMQPSVFYTHIMKL